MDEINFTGILLVREMKDIEECFRRLFESDRSKCVLFKRISNRTASVLVASGLKVRRTWFTTVVWT